MEKLDPARYRTMPWKNGGGVTTEALVVPADASFDTFQLRVSMARVESDGPFSKLPGIDRTLVVTEGAGLALAREDGSSVTLEVGSAPFGFSGDEAIHATLLRGEPVVDLNVMTRRANAKHVVRRRVVSSLGPLELSGDLSLVIVLAGEARLLNQAGGVPTELVAHTGDIVTHAARDGAEANESDLDARAEGGSEAHLLVVDVSFSATPLR